MKVGPSESAFEEQAPNRPKLLSVKSRVVVSIGDKSDEVKLMQVRVRETTTRESRHSVVIQRLVVKTRGFSIFWDKPAGYLNYWAGGDRRRGDVTLTRALMRNCGNQGIDAKGEGTSGRNHEAESTDA